MAKGTDVLELDEAPGSGVLDGAIQVPVKLPGFPRGKLHRAPVSRLPAGGAGGPAQDYVSTETVGGIRAGDTFTTNDPAVVQLLVTYQAPGFTAFAVGGQGSRTVPVGTQFGAGFKSFTWATANSTNVQANSLRLQDVTANVTLASNEANDGSLSASTAAFAAVDGESRRYRLTGLNNKGGQFLADIVIAGSYPLFFGPTNASPTNDTTARALSQTQLAAQGNGGILNTGTTALKMAIVLPPGRTLQNVTDLDNQGLNLTSKYVAQPTISVNDASGAPVAGYTPYVLSIATPYTASARHQFTYA